MNGNNNDLQEAPTWLSVVAQQVKSLHFGVVQIVVHNDRVVQIERTEKIRFNEANGPIGQQPKWI